MIMHATTAPGWTWVHNNPHDTSIIRARTYAAHTVISSYVRASAAGDGLAWLQRGVGCLGGGDAEVEQADSAGEGQRACE